MKTQIVYVLVSSEQDYFLEELWVSVYSLRQFHPNVNVTVLTDQPTSKRILQRQALTALITNTIVVPVPENYNNKFRSRVIKTSVRNLIDGDYLYIDTDTVITGALNEIDSLCVKNIAMVPEMHDLFSRHIYYRYTCNDVKRIYGEDVSDCQYWYNAGVTFVRDCPLTREFFSEWNKKWEYSALTKGNSSDMRALICTDKQFGYIIEHLPDIYNSQVAMSIQYLYDAKIVHFWHMRNRFTPDMNYSPFCNKDIYKQLRKDGEITEDTANIIRHCKSSFGSPSMIIGRSEITLLFSSFCSVLGQSYQNNKYIHSLLNGVIKAILFNRRMKQKLFTNNHRK